MRQRWRPLGRQFRAGSIAGSRGYAALPVVSHLEGDRYRVFYSDRDASGRSVTRCLVGRLDESGFHVEESGREVLAPGGTGLFDDSGAMATELLTVGGHDYLYYVGWNLGVTVPFRNSIGLAVAEAGSDVFEKHGPAPVVDRNAVDPHFVASCCVLPAERGGLEMWYLSCLGWDRLASGEQRHRYHIRYATSDDGIDWRRDGTVAIELSDDGEYAISSPRVLRRESGATMWYSHRGGPGAERYRIGFATSSDGRSWVRSDELELPIDGDWDSEMRCYPYVVEHDGQRFMFYNGNGYGATGIGLAVLE